MKNSFLTLVYIFELTDVFSKIFRFLMLTKALFIKNTVKTDISLQFKSLLSNLIYFKMKFIFDAKLNFQHRYSSF